MAPVSVPAKMKGPETLALELLMGSRVMIRRSESAILSDAQYPLTGLTRVRSVTKSALTRHGDSSGTVYIGTQRKSRAAYLVKGCGNVVEHFASISVCECSRLGCSELFYE